MFEKPAPLTAQVMIRMTDVERGYLVEEAGKHGVSLAAFIRSIIEKHLRAKKKGR